MSSIRFRHAFPLVIALFLLSVSVAFAQVSSAPLNPEYLQWQRDYAGRPPVTAEGHALGYIPPPFKHPIVAGARALRPLVGAPATYDLRDIAGKVPTVRDQGACGSCWTFATFGSLETFLRPTDTTDFSENNLKNRHGWDWGPCDGGNPWVSTAYLSRWEGPALESQDPYSDSPGVSSQFAPDKHVQEVLFLPAMTGPTDTDTIKNAIMDYGAVYVNYYSAAYYYANGTSVAFYHPSASSTNHAVCIIGWDDNYASTNFLPGTQPPGNGAWLVRNSWGATWGYDGHFWGSYYDSKLGKSSVVVFNSAESPDNYQHIYLHDPLGNIDALSAPYSANVFTATDAQKLNAVGFWTEVPGATYTVRIYRNPTPVPAGGTPALTTTGSFLEAGYHTVPLPSPVSVAAGDRFSVVVQYTNGGSYPSGYEFAYPGVTSGATASPGQSYYSTNGLGWTDLTSYNSTANFCIKAFADDNQVPTAPTESAISPTDPKTASNLTATAIGSTDADPGDTVSYQHQWRCSTDGGDSWDDWGRTGSTLPSSNTAKDEQWQARSRGTDGTEAGPWVESTPVTILNTAPTAPTACTITPAEPITGSDLTASATGSNDDDSGDTVSYEYQWRSSTDGGDTWSDWGRDGDTIGNADTTKGEQWQARGRATDGTEYSDWFESDAVTIGNTAPIPPTTCVISPSEPKTDDDLTVAAGGSTDVDDGDTVTYEHQWRVSADGGTTWGDWGYDGDTLPSAATERRDVWQARSRATDGTDASDWLESDPVTIRSVDITAGPEGAPNPVGSGGQMVCSVTAVETPGGHGLDYAWTATDGGGNPAGAFDDQTAAGPTWTAPANTSDNPVSYTISVTVSCQDDASINDSGTFTADVDPVEHTVTITSGPAAAPDPVESSGDVACSVEAVDSRDGHTVSYRWTATDGEGTSVGGFSDPDAQNPTWTAPANISEAQKQYTLTVVAFCSDHPEIRDQGACTVNVNPTAHEIIITETVGGIPNPRSSGGTVLCGVHARDTHNHAVTYQWRAEDGDGNPAGTFDDATLQFPSWTAPENLTDAAIPCEVTVTVSCAHNPAVNTSVSFTVQVNPVGHHVTITDGPAADPNPVASGGQVGLSATAIDSRDGHAVSYAWTAQDVGGNPAGAFDDANAQNPVWTAPENTGDHTARYTVTCTATCDDDAGVNDVATVTVHVSPVEHAVNITAGPQGAPNPAEAGDDVQCSVTAECSRAGHALQYVWTARDGNGAVAGSFSNPTAPNPVWHAPASVPAENNEYQISVTVTCQSAPSVRATGSFAQQVTRPAHAIELTQPPQGPGGAINSGATMQCTVEANDTHGHAVTYLWTAADAGGNPAGSFNNPSLQHPRWTAPANETGAVANYTITVTITCPEDAQITREASFVQQVRPVAMHTFASGARMIGVPVQSATPPDVQAAAGVADAVWWNPALPAYVPHNAADPFVVARGYWARFLGATTMVVHGTSVSGNVDQNFDDGWHMIASPYQYQLGLDAITGCANLKPYAWTDQGRGYELVAALSDALNAVHTTINPWWGYWVDADGPGTLRWSPAQAAAGSAPVELLQIGAADADRGGWQIQLVAEAGGRVDACNFLGIAGDSAVRALDIANPPLNPDGVDLYFAAGARPMAADIRPLASTDLGWDFVVTSGVDGPVTLSFPDLSGVPAQYRLTLTDVASGKSLNMRTSRGYQYNGVGTRAFRIEATRGNGNTLTVSTADARQLNSAAATVTYTLSTAADVIVDIRNIAGRTVAQIACGQAAAGANTAAWNLCGAGGARVPAGTYLCTITARADDGTQASAVRTLSVIR